MTYVDELVHVQTHWKPKSTGPWGREEAITTFWLRHVHQTGNTFDWSAELGGLPERIVNKYNDHWDFLSPYISTHAQLQGVKCTRVDAAGHTIDRSEFSGAPAPLDGTGGDNMMPPETAVVVSTWAYEPGGFTTHRGRKRGRFYVPYVPVGICDAYGTIAGWAVDAMASAWRDFLSDVNGMHAGDLVPPNLEWDSFQLMAVSKKGTTAEQIHWVSVDDHFDSQRRRQHQQPANRIVATPF